MVIEQIDIHRFGKLTGFKTDLDPSFNLIEGPNESGKSTLASFILYMLYGFDDREGSEDMPERRLRAPWDGEDASGTMTVREGGSRYLIERTSMLDETGKRDHCTITALDTGEVTVGGASPGERFLGVGREVFESTAFLAASSMPRVDGESMTEAIENIVFSGDEKLSVLGAMRALSETKNEILSSGGKGGIIVSLQKERDELVSRLAVARQRERELIEQENLLFVTRAKRKECSKELAKFRRLETDYYNAMMIRDYDRLHELEDSAEARERAIRDYEVKHREGGFLPDASYLTELATAKADMDHAEALHAQTKKTLEEALATGLPVLPEEEALLSRLRSAGSEDSLRTSCAGELRTKLKFTVAFILGFAAAGLFLILSILGYAAFGTGATLFFAALCFLSLGVGGVCLLEEKKVKGRLLMLYDLGGAVTKDAFEQSLLLAADAERRKAEHEERVRSAREAHEEASVARERTAETLGRALSRWHEDLTVDEHYAETVSKLIEEIGEYISHASELHLKKEAAEAEVRALRARLAGQNEIAVRALVPPPEREALCNHNAADLRHGVEHYEKMLESFTDKEDALASALAAMRNEESSADIAEQIMQLDRRMDALRERATLYGMAEEKLEGSLDRLRTELSPRLSLYACSMLDELTDGKYTELSIDDGMTLSVGTEAGEKEVGYLSHGTKEMTYLALRMALIDLLYRTEAPLCLDECTAHLDDERAASFMRALRTLASEGKQCLLFSCHPRERRLADAVFASYRRITMN